jgi:hypothetical protein
MLFDIVWGSGLFLLGGYLVLLGCYAVLNRREKAGRVKEVRGLEPIQDVLGDGPGSVVHFVVFAVAPIAVGGYLIAIAVGWDRLWQRESLDETPAELRSTPEQDAELRLDMAEARLAGAGFAVVRLEHGQGMQVSEAGFSGAIRKSGSGWRVECGGHEPYEVLSLNDAEAQILECHRPP